MISFIGEDLEVDGCDRWVAGDGLVTTVGSSVSASDVMPVYLGGLSLGDETQS